VSSESAAGAEAILEQAAEQRLVFGERHHAVANIARGKNAIFTAQAAGTAAVVGHGDDRGEIHDGPLRGGIRIMAWDDVQLKSAKNRGEAGAAAESNHANSARRGRRSASFLFHESA